MNRVYLVAILGIGILTSAVQSEELYVDNPFVSETARNNFFRCFPDRRDDTDAIAAMKAITRISYSKSRVEGCPFDAEDCASDQEFFRGMRRTKLSAPYLSTSKARSVADQARKNGCSYSRVSGFSHTVGSKAATVRFNWRHQKRACDNFFGKHNICESTAKVEHTIQLKPDFTLSERMRVYDEQMSCFGLPADDLKVAFTAMGVASGGLLGGLAGFIVTDEITRESELDAASFLGNGVRLDAAAAISEEVGNRDQFVMGYDRSFDASGFLKQGDAGSLEYVEVGFLDALFENYYWKERQREVKFLKDLSRIDRTIYTMQSGDTLWEIARDEYGVAELYLLIEGMNGVRGSELKVGQQIELPLQHEVCEAVNDSGIVVRKGDSLWLKVERGDIAVRNFHSIVTRSGDANLIYPFEMLQIRND